MAPHRRRAAFLPEMETERVFVPTFSTWGEEAERRSAVFQLTQANAPNKVEEHFHFVFQLILNHV